MDAFSYLAVLLSIVLGLGLTQILTATGRVIRHRDSIRLHWLPLLWAALLLLIYVQAWWAMYGMRLRQNWTFVAFAIVLAQTATLYLMAAVVLPEQLDEAGTDLGVYFDKHHRWFFALFLLTLVISVSKDLVLGGTLPNGANLAFHGLFAAGCVIGIVARQRRAQEFLGVGFAIGVFAYVALLFARLR